MATIRTETQGRVAIIRLDRPQALNALNRAVAEEIAEAAEGFDRDPDIGCIVVTGSDKAFAAGADIKEMQPAEFRDMIRENWFATWDRFTAIRIPTIAAVNGYALGGGCELAMMCDIILAGDKARFGQPEIRLGVMPGMGGTQRLTRLVGRSKAMELCLTGRMMDAAEAERSGLVARVFPAADLEAEAIAMAAEIAERSRLVTMMLKETVHRADEVSLSEGMRFERRLFHAMFALEDQKEGMAAYIEKREPRFRRD
ncbi:enoyl-CoA hydratase [Aureimonas altamirensis DSM 21988]|uniref:Enoyl-CoA hydratase n=1 Tax=Aureimonas altamirensis DSM 21988 TaxID=1121026 RepID=A0ABY1IN46_9HYPH|nr:enoyl-CoA hydratase [Aureimonas altamirensis]SHJ53814.1 enoyl-CoA hydratase [Aureimonas altamirensis DSM 21988]